MANIQGPISNEKLKHKKWALHQWALTFVTTTNFATEEKNKKKKKKKEKNVMDCNLSLLLNRQSKCREPL